jgi:hypothetical protein
LAVLFGSTFRPILRPYIHAVLFGCSFSLYIFRPYILSRIFIGRILQLDIKAVLFGCIFIHIFSGRLFIGPILRLDFKAVLFGCTFKPYIKAGFLSRDY